MPHIKRISYKKIKEQIDKNSLIKQRLLIPEIVELLDESKTGILDKNKATLAKLGLTIEKFGKKSIMVLEILSLVGYINVRNLVSDLADCFTSLGENIALTELIEHITETYACHYEIRVGRKLSAK